MPSNYFPISHSSVRLFNKVVRHGNTNFLIILIKILFTTQILSFHTYLPFICLFLSSEIFVLKYLSKSIKQCWKHFLSLSKSPLEVLIASWEYNCEKEGEPLYANLVKVRIPSVFLLFENQRYPFIISSSVGQHLIICYVRDIVGSIRGHNWVCYGTHLREFSLLENMAIKMDAIPCDWHIHHMCNDRW